MVLGEIKDNAHLSSEKANTSTFKLKKGSSEQRVVPSQAYEARSRVLSYMNSKSRTLMVIEAVGAISTDECGASVPAITKWILANYAITDISKLKVQVKKATLKCLDYGTIARAGTSKGSLGASGSFVLGKSKNPPLSQRNKGSAKKPRDHKKKSLKPQGEKADKETRKKSEEI